jgi:NAD-dependent dihydropyrimidine dehydrogenase PreA subunit
MLKKNSAKLDRKKKVRAEILEPLEIEEFFVDGEIIIDKGTCKGVECQLCIKACPTYALFWKAGEVGIIEELCIYCGACVLNCIVNNCIEIKRERVTGEVESFSNPREYVTLQYQINAEKRSKKIKETFPNQDNLRRQKTTSKEKSH